jgi:hypothetical protein
LSRKHSRVDDLTWPWTATSAPPAAREVEGVIVVHAGNMRKGRAGKRSSDESETSKEAAPPAPGHAEQLIIRQRTEAVPRGKQNAQTLDGGGGLRDHCGTERDDTPRTSDPARVETARIEPSSKHSDLESICWK